MKIRRGCIVGSLGCMGVLGVLLFALAAFLEDIDPAGGNPYAHRMHIACGKGDTRAVYEMIQQGADVNEPVWEDTVALMWAAAGGHLNTVKILLAAGADVNADSGHGSVLAFANGSGGPDKAKIIDLLTRAGAK